jgi:hypothetical protein
LLPQIIIINSSPMRDNTNKLMVIIELFICNQSPTFCKNNYESNTFLVIYYFRWIYSGWKFSRNRKSHNFGTIQQQQQHWSPTKSCWRRETTGKKWPFKNIFTC